MALDRPDDDFEAGEARLEQHVRSGRSGSDVSALRSEPAESRTHEEYYEALRAADNASDGEKPTQDSPDDDRPGEDRPGEDSAGDDRPEEDGVSDDRPVDDSPDDDRPIHDTPDDDKPGEDGSADDPHVVDSRADNSGWDAVDIANRPPVEAIGVSPARRGHILDGDADGRGGGHRHGTGIPGKTEFPASWDDEKIIDAVLDVARRPDHPPRQQERKDRWVARGTRDDVEVVVVIEPDGPIWTSWPLPGGPGVVKNPKER